MSNTRVTVCLLIGVSVLFGLVFWNHYHTKSLIHNAIAEKEQAHIEFWQERLFPLYEDMEIEYKKAPQTQGELFGPLVELLKPVGGRDGDSTPQGRG